MHFCNYYEKFIQTFFFKENFNSKNFFFQAFQFPLVFIPQIACTSLAIAHKLDPFNSTFNTASWVSKSERESGKDRNEVVALLENYHHQLNIIIKKWCLKREKERRSRRKMFHFMIYVKNIVKWWNFLFLPPSIATTTATEKAIMKMVENYKHFMWMK